MIQLNWVLKLPLSCNQLTYWIHPWRKRPSPAIWECCNWQIVGSRYAIAAVVELVLGLFFHTSTSYTVDEASGIALVNYPVTKFPEIFSAQITHHNQLPDFFIGIAFYTLRE